jgi:hypothetical protein
MQNTCLTATRLLTKFGTTTAKDRENRKTRKNKKTNEKKQTNRLPGEVGVVRDLLAARVSQPPQLLVDLLLNERYLCVFPKTQHGKKRRNIYKKIIIKGNKNNSELNWKEEENTRTTNRK